MRKLFVSELIRHSHNNSKIVFLTADLGYGVVESFRQIFPNRFYNLGICEQAIMSIAGGFASKEYRPFVYSIANFPTFRCLEQIRNDVCHMNNPVTIVAVGTGFSYGTAGYSHYLIEDLAAMQGLNISIFSPATPEETTKAIEQILLDHKPAYLRLPRVELPSNSEIYSISEPGSFNMLESLDVLLIALGSIAHTCVDAQRQLSQRGIRSAVFNCDSFDHLTSFVSALNDYNFPVFSIEEHVLQGGLGTRLLELFPRPERLNRLGISLYNSLIVGDEEQLRHHYGLSSQGISETIQGRLQKNL
jgi:transketolase